MSDSPSTPPFWELAWRNAQPRLQSIQASLDGLPIVPPRIARVGQLDSELLDQELLNVLKEPIIKALGVIRVSLLNIDHLLSMLMLDKQLAYETMFEPELSLVIAATLYKFSMWDQGATYGAKLQDLKYRVAHSSGVRKLARASSSRM